MIRCRTRALPFLFALVLATAVAWSARAGEDRAAPDGRFSLAIADCPSQPESAIRRILGIEIGDLLLPETAVVPVNGDRLSIRCTGHFARIQATGQAATTPFEQVVNLEDFPGDAAPRALALAGLELLASLNAQVRARIEAKAPSASPPPPAPPPHDLRIGVAGTGRAFLVDQGALLWGGRVNALFVASRRWALTFDLDIARGQKSVANLGEATAWLFSSAATVGLHGRAGSLAGMVGLGGRFGVVRLTGTSAQPGTVVGESVAHPWGGPLGMMGGTIRFARFSLGLQVEVGRALLASQGSADGATVLATGGTWLGLSLGAGVHP